MKKYIWYLILSVNMLLYQELYHMDYQQSLNAQHSLKTQVRWVNQRKLDGLVLAATASFWILDVPILLASFQRLVFGGQV
jgi:hypothetical protein